MEAAPDADRRARLLLNEEVGEILDAYPDRGAATRYDRELEVVVDRPLARFAAWYELFPRSQSRVPGRHGTFQDCIERLPEIAGMGFDVIYLAPDPPDRSKLPEGAQQRARGRVPTIRARRGPSATSTAAKAIEPALGTLADFGPSSAARDHGMEVALDYALQCSPDHPWVTEHPVVPPPTRRDDQVRGEPPKKYQDIYPLNFYGQEREALWEEAKGILLFWIEQGIRIFRVDNPHTKPIPFWTWVITEVQAGTPTSSSSPRPSRARAS